MPFLVRRIAMPDTGIPDLKIVFLCDFCREPMRFSRSKEGEKGSCAKCGSEQEIRPHDSWTMKDDNGKADGPINEEALLLRVVGGKVHAQTPLSLDGTSFLPAEAYFGTGVLAADSSFTQKDGPDGHERSGRLSKPFALLSEIRNLNERYHIGLVAKICICGILMLFAFVGVYGCWKMIRDGRADHANERKPRVRKRAPGAEAPEPEYREIHYKCGKCGRDVGIMGAGSTDPRLARCGPCSLKEEKERETLKRLEYLDRIHRDR